MNFGKSAENLRDAMRPGKVYRRQDLEELTTAVDRDLKTLVDAGEVKRLAGGLYYRPAKNAFGAAPPDDRDLVRAFLKTNDFLLTSYNHFNQLGLGLTQVYSASLVYNHKRAGEFTLGGRRFHFRRVPAFPRKLSREFLLVDLLNNLKHLPDDTGMVLQNLQARLGEFDREEVQSQLERYGSTRARRVLSGVHA